MTIHLKGCFFKVREMKSEGKERGRGRLRSVCESKHAEAFRETRVNLEKRLVRDRRTCDLSELCSLRKISNFLREKL